MPLYQTILIPLENSPADGTILEHIRALARLCGSRIILVHVADGHVARNQEQLNLEDSEEMRTDRAYLSQRQEDLRRDGFEVSCQLACGDPAEQIIRLAHNEHCDLIAMSTHGHGFIKDALLGSVANEVRHRTDIPVLMVRVPVAKP